MTILMNMEARRWRLPLSTTTETPSQEAASTHQALTTPQQHGGEPATPRPAPIVMGHAPSIAVDPAAARLAIVRVAMFGLVVIGFSCFIFMCIPYTGTLIAIKRITASATVITMPPKKKVPPTSSTRCVAATETMVISKPQQL